MGFSRRKNNKCRNPSHARAPRRNPSPLLGPVTSGLAHVSTDQHPIWSDLGVFRVSCRSVFIICLAQTPALPEISLLPIQNVCRNLITICTHTHTQKTRIQHIFYHFSCLTNTVTQDGNFCFSSALLAFKIKDCPFDRQPMKLQEPWKMCEACPNLFFLWGPSAPFSKRPACGVPIVALYRATARISIGFGKKRSFGRGVFSENPFIKGGLSLGGVASMTVFGGSGEHLTFLSCPTIVAQEQ